MQCAVAQRFREAEGSSLNGHLSLKFDKSIKPVYVTVRVKFVAGVNM